jgi:hypothetical protein
MRDFGVENWRQVDALLAQSQVFPAVVLFRDVTGCGIAEAKDAVGERFRLVFPDLWQAYRNIGEDE